MRPDGVAEKPLREREHDPNRQRAANHGDPSREEIDVSATLKLKREGAGIELRRGPFEIAVDGSGVGRIEWHQTVELPLEPGRHILQIRAGRHSSQTEAFDVADEESVEFRCHGAMLWPRYVVSIIVPSLAISLKRT